MRCKVSGIKCTQNSPFLISPTVKPYNFHGIIFDQDGQIAYFDTIDNHGCLKVEKLVLSVDEFQMPPTLNQYECYTHGTTPSWYWDKTGITYHEDTYDEIVLDDPNGGCPIKHRLNLRFHEEFYQSETREACDAYYWPVSGETYYESQDGITKTFHYDFGDVECDSTYVLNLTISDNETHVIDISDDDYCDSYTWDPQGHPYTTTDTYDPIDHVYTVPGTYQRTYKNQMDCDSIVKIQMVFDYTPHPTEIYPMDTTDHAPHWVVTATEFQINAYDFHLWDTNPECSWDTVTWSFEEPNRWVLEPFGEKGKCCKVYVLNHVDDTVWLNARAFNHCVEDEGVIQRYWFICSFYDIDEYGPSTGSGTVGFDVIPNPNNGQMKLVFDHLTGKIDIKVYDMRGTLIDNLQTYNEIGSNSMQYNLNGGFGVYFFVATGKEGVMAKKVIVR